MTHVLQRIGRLITGLMVLCLSIQGHGQTESETDEQPAESSPERVSVYETLVFDRPVAVLPGEEPVANDAVVVYTNTVPPGELSADQVLSLQRFQDNVSAVEFEGGAWDINLTENLTSIGEIYQRQGMHQEAIDAYTRAMHVSRVNFGLNSLDHLPLVERLVDSYMVLGDWESANQYQEYLYYTQRREYGMNDPRMATVMHRRANWELSVFNARWGDELGGKLINALNLYRSASTLVSIHFGPNDERYSRYLRDTAGTAYLVSRYQTLIRETTPAQYSPAQNFYLESPRGGFSMGFEDGYEDGLSALQSLVESFPEEDRNTEEYAQALILEADWYLLFERRRAAQERYRAAYTVIEALENAEALIDRTFGAVKPLPYFSELIESIFVKGNFEGRASVAQETGYIDVQFDVNAYGSVANLEVLTDDAEVDSRVVSTLRRQIRRTVFRPRVQDGEVIRTSGNRFRYRYAY